MPSTVRQTDESHGSITTQQGRELSTDQRIVHYYNRANVNWAICGGMGWLTGNRLRVSCPVCIAAMEGC